MNSKSKTKIHRRIGRNAHRLTFCRVFSIWFEIYDPKMHYMLSIRPFSIRFNLFGNRFLFCRCFKSLSLSLALSTSVCLCALALSLSARSFGNPFECFHCMHMEILDMLLVTMFQFLSVWNLKLQEVLGFLHKIRFFRIILLLCMLPLCRLFLPFFLLFGCIFFHVGRERINCKTIQFIQKCFFALAQRYRWQQNCHTTSKKERNRTYLTALMALLYMHFLFSFVFFLHFTLYFIIYIFVVVVIVVCSSFIFICLKIAKEI